MKTTSLPKRRFHDSHFDDLDDALLQIKAISIVWVFGTVGHGAIVIRRMLVDGALIVQFGINFGDQMLCYNFSIRRGP